jgi:hypothetical protein
VDGTPPQPGFALLHINVRGAVGINATRGSMLDLSWNWGVLEVDNAKHQLVYSPGELEEGWRGSQCAAQRSMAPWAAWRAPALLSGPASKRASRPLLRLHTCA